MLDVINHAYFRGLSFTLQPIDPMILENPTPMPGGRPHVFFFLYFKAMQMKDSEIIFVHLYGVFSIKIFL